MIELLVRSKTEILRLNRNVDIGFGICYHIPVLVIAKDLPSG